ncbi:MAG: nucleotidyltransferase domain-containing protein [Acidilobaceae archaeon]
MSEVEVVYSRERWKLLEEKRRLAASIMRALASSAVYSIVHGSVARGDVDEDSDVDVFVVNPTPPLLVELALERAGYKARWKEVIQATPSSTPKAYIYLDDRGLVVVSLPLGALSKTERVLQVGRRGYARRPGERQKAPRRGQEAHAHRAHALGA